jgi:F0F1-type ATP synthase delta subunit
VVSAHELSATLKRDITKLIGAREVHFSETIDPDVLGGVRIETPGKLLDATIQRKLLALRQAKQ